MNLIFDTNILIDALQDRRPFSDNAKKLLLLAADNKIDAFVPASSVTDLYYILHRSLRNSKSTKNVLKDLFLSLQILDATNSDCRNALFSPISDFEDAVLAETALRNKIDYIITRNKKDFTTSKIPAKTPPEILKLLKNV